MLTSRTTRWVISLTASMMLFGSWCAIAGVNDPVINSAVVNSSANTLLIAGTNLLGADNNTIPVVHFAGMVLPVLNSSPTSITAGFPGSSPASSLGGGVYTLTLVYSFGPIINFEVPVGSSGIPTTTAFNVVMSVDDVSCETTAGHDMFPVAAWTLGASTPLGSGGAGGSGPQLTNLTINKTFDDCSPDLFGNLVSGHHFNKAVLTQYGADHSALVVVTLVRGLVAGYKLTGGSANLTPTEDVSFSYELIDIKDAVTGSHFCWNLAQNLACPGP